MPAIRPDFLGSTSDCPCGRSHAIAPKWAWYGPDASARLAELAKGHRRAVVVADARTHAAMGEQVLEALAAAGVPSTAVMVPDRPEGLPVCDDATRQLVREQVRQALGAGGGLVITVGSGVVTDLGKWSAFELGLPFAAAATALSMNGYTSANVAPTIGGLKTLVEAAPPVAVAADPRVLAAAPYEMTAAGLGHVLAKSVSSADWLLNHLLFGDYYCPRAVGLIEDIEPLYADRPELLKARDAGAMAALLEALLLTGVAMTMAGSSAPASGGEHMLSHALDMMSGLDRRPHDLHGRQVGVGTILAAELYRRVLSVESPDWRLPPEPELGFWGPLAPAVREQWSRKLPRYRLAHDALSRGSRWDELRTALAGVPRPPEVIRDCLRRAGAAWRAEDLGMDADRLCTAWLHAHEIRSRFTVLDLAELLGLKRRCAVQAVT